MKKVSYWTLMHTRTVGFEVRRQVSNTKGKLVYLTFSDAALDGWYPESDVVLKGVVSVTDNNFTESKS